MDAGWDQISATANQGSSTSKTFCAHDLISKEVTVKEPGYAYVFISNEHPTFVETYFDDLTITHTQSPIVAGSDYYPFGLVMDDRTITDEAYRYGYQGQYSEKNDSTGWNEFQLRMYDARFGRWLSPDPYGQFWSPYVGMGNIPHMGTDPDGGLCCGGGGRVVARTAGRAASGSAKAGLTTTILNEVVVTASSQTFSKLLGPAVISLSSTLSGGAAIEYGNQQWQPEPELNLRELKPNTADLYPQMPDYGHRLRAIEPDFFEKLSQGNLLSSTVYETADAVYLAAHFFMPWKSKSDTYHLNGDGLLADDGAEAIVLTAAMFIPTLPGKFKLNKVIGTFGQYTKTVPAKVGGQSRAVYTWVKNIHGRTIRFYKDTFGKNGEFIHRKHKLPKFE